eukprot:scaffold266421_cov32-Attheya_sp.AAC.1
MDDMDVPSITGDASKRSESCLWRHATPHHATPRSRHKDDRHIPSANSLCERRVVAFTAPRPRPHCHRRVATHPNIGSLVYDRGVVWCGTARRSMSPRQQYIPVTVAERPSTPHNHN